MNSSQLRNIKFILCNGDEMSKSSEYKFWSHYLTEIVRDAMGVFDFPHKNSSLDRQYQNLRNKYIKNPPQFIRRSELHHRRHTADDTSKARFFLESSNFDEIVVMIGYESEFVKRTFDMVQTAVSYEKKLFEEFRLTSCQNNII